MTPEERQALKDERLRLRVECLRREAEIQQLRIANGQADLHSTEFEKLPHREYWTRVHRTPNGEGWYCVPMHVDRGDVSHYYPCGWGRTPADACADFDRLWTEGDYDDPAGGEQSVC